MLTNFTRTRWAFLAIVILASSAQPAAATPPGILLSYAQPTEDGQHVFVMVCSDLYPTPESETSTQTEPSELLRLRQRYAKSGLYPIQPEESTPEAVWTIDWFSPAVLVSPSGEWLIDVYYTASRPSLLIYRGGELISSIDPNELSKASLSESDRPRPFNQFGGENITNSEFDEQASTVLLTLIDQTQAQVDLRTAQVTPQRSNDSHTPYPIHCRLGIDHSGRSRSGLVVVSTRI